MQAAGSIERSAPETLPQRDAKGDLLKSARYSQASDMWSIGAILYRLFAGELLLDLEEHQYQTESEEFNNLAMACMGQERDILDNAASKAPPGHPMPSLPHFPLTLPHPSHTLTLTV